MISFDEENSYLPIKTAAEYFYCERAAFYMLMGWENNLENPYLYKGSQHHQVIERLPYKHRKEMKIVYRQPVTSYVHEIYGFCDAVEFSRAGVPQYPIEYKTGKTRHNFMHIAQLHLQVLCLEEMYSIKIPTAYIFFVESRSREAVKLSCRERVHILAKVREMRDKVARGEVAAFRPCGSPFCSYHAIDDPALYSRKRRKAHVLS